jgi:hypothetical protein
MNRPLDQNCVDTRTTWTSLRAQESILLRVFNDQADAGVPIEEVHKLYNLIQRVRRLGDRAFARHMRVFGSDLFPYGSS